MVNEYANSTIRDAQGNIIGYAPVSQVNPYLPQGYTDTQSPAAIINAQYQQQYGAVVGSTPTYQQKYTQLAIPTNPFNQNTAAAMAFEASQRNEIIDPTIERKARQQGFAGSARIYTKPDGTIDYNAGRQTVEFSDITALGLDSNKKVVPVNATVPAGGAAVVGLENVKGVLNTVSSEIYFTEKLEGGVYGRSKTSPLTNIVGGGGASAAASGAFSMGKPGSILVLNRDWAMYPEDDTRRVNKKLSGAGWEDVFAAWGTQKGKDFSRPGSELYQMGGVKTDERTLKPQAIQQYGSDEWYKAGVSSSFLKPNVSRGVYDKAPEGVIGNLANYVQRGKDEFGNLGSAPLDYVKTGKNIVADIPSSLFGALPALVLQNEDATKFQAWNDPAVINYGTTKGSSTPARYSGEGKWVNEVPKETFQRVITGGVINADGSISGTPTQKNPEGYWDSTFQMLPNPKYTEPKLPNPFMNIDAAPTVYGSRTIGGETFYNPFAGGAVATKLTVAEQRKLQAENAPVQWYAAADSVNAKRRIGEGAPGEFKSFLPEITQEQATAFYYANKGKPAWQVSSDMLGGALNYDKSVLLGALQQTTSFIPGYSSANLFPPETYVVKKGVPAEIDWIRTSGVSGGSPEQTALRGWLTTTSDKLTAKEISLNLNQRSKWLTSASTGLENERLAVNPNDAASVAAFNSKLSAFNLEYASYKKDSDPFATELGDYNTKLESYKKMAAKNPEESWTLDTPTLRPGTGVPEVRENQWKLFTEGTGQVARRIYGTSAEQLKLDKEYWMKQPDDLMGGVGRANFAVKEYLLTQPANLAPAAIQGAAFYFGAGLVGAGVGALAEGTSFLSPLISAGRAAPLATPTAKLIAESALTTFFGMGMVSSITDNFKATKQEMQYRAGQSIPPLAAMMGGAGGFNWVTEVRPVNRVTPSGGTAKGISIYDQFFGGGRTPTGERYAGMGNAETGFTRFGGNPNSLGGVGSGYTAPPGGATRPLDFDYDFTKPPSSSGGGAAPSPFTYEPPKVSTTKSKMATPMSPADLAKQSTKPVTNLDTILNMDGSSRPVPGMEPVGKSFPMPDVQSPLDWNPNTQVFDALQPGGKLKRMYNPTRAGEPDWTGMDFSITSGKAYGSPTSMQESALLERGFKLTKSGAWEQKSQQMKLKSVGGGAYNLGNAIGLKMEETWTPSGGHYKTGGIPKDQLMIPESTAWSIETSPTLQRYKDKVWDDRFNSSEAFNGVIRELGLDKKPTVLSKQEFAEYESDFQPMGRSFKKASYAANALYGNELRVPTKGGRSYGSASMYAAVDTTIPSYYRDIDLGRVTYDKFVPKEKAVEPYGSVYVNLKLKAGTKVAKYDDLSLQRDVDLAGMPNNIQALFGRDIGLYAAAKGIGAIEMGVEGKGYVTVIDRSAIIAERPNFGEQVNVLPRERVFHPDIPTKSVLIKSFGGDFTSETALLFPPMEPQYVGKITRSELRGFSEVSSRPVPGYEGQPSKTDIYGEEIDYAGMERSVRPLVKKINTYPGLQTISSAGGHIFSGRTRAHARAWQYPIIRDFVGETPRGEFFVRGSVIEPSSASGSFNEILSKLKSEIATGKVSLTLDRLSFEPHVTYGRSLTSLDPISVHDIATEKFDPLSSEVEFNIYGKGISAKQVAKILDAPVQKPQMIRTTPRGNNEFVMGKHSMLNSVLPEGTVLRPEIVNNDMIRLYRGEPNRVGLKSESGKFFTTDILQAEHHTNPTIREYINNKPIPIDSGDIGVVSFVDMFKSDAKPFMFKSGEYILPADIAATKKPIASWEQRQLDIKTGKRTSTPTAEEITIFGEKYGTTPQMIRRGGKRISYKPRKIPSVSRKEITTGGGFDFSDMARGGLGDGRGGGESFGGGVGAISKTAGVIPKTKVMTKVETKIISIPNSRIKTTLAYTSRAKAAAESLAASKATTRSYTTPSPDPTGLYDAKWEVDSPSHAGSLAIAGVMGESTALSNPLGGTTGVSTFRQGVKSVSPSRPYERSLTSTRPTGLPRTVPKGSGKIIPRGRAGVVTNPRPLFTPIEKFVPSDRNVKPSAFTGFPLKTIDPFKDIVPFKQQPIRDIPPVKDIPPVRDLPPQARPLPPPPITIPLPFFGGGGGGGSGSAGSGRGMSSHTETIYMRSSLNELVFGLGGAVPQRRAAQPKQRKSRGRKK